MYEQLQHRGLFFILLLGDAMILGIFFGRHFTDGDKTVDDTQYQHSGSDVE